MYNKDLWRNVKREHVIKAIEKFERSGEDYPKPKNTFLIYNGKEYPAKHIRGIAFEIANKIEISKSEYSGGQETVNFFKRLGFQVKYKNEIFDKTKAKEDTSRKKLSVIEQKNALQRLLQKMGFIVETEKKFNWLKTPDPNKLPKEYKKIVNALKKYRNRITFLKPNYALPCDMVIEEEKNNY